MRVIGRTLAPLAALGVIGMALAGCSTSPDEPLAALSPAEPNTNDRLILQIAERPGIDYTVVWALDGAVVEDLTGLEIPADRTERGQEWEATITPVDEDGNEYDPTIVSVTIGNAAPGGIVTLSPSAPLTGQDMEAQLGFIDPDEGDTVSAVYSWTQNGSDAGISTNVVPGDQLQKGDVWQVTVVASDGTNESPPATATAVVANTPPQAEGATIAPEEVFDDTTVTCAGIRFTDADGDAEGYKYIWKVDGAIVSSEPELTGEFFDRGQLITCELIPTDGEDDGNRVFSAPVKVGNGVPTMDSVTIDQAAPTRNEPITFTTNNLTDADGDEITLDIYWLVNGRGVSQEAALDPSLFKKGDVVRVRVTPSDGTQAGETQTSGEVTVENAPPIIVESGFTVSPVYTDSLLQPSYEVIDNDGDPVTVSFTWSVEGTTVGDATGMLDGADEAGNGFDRGDSVTYTLVANDGEDDSTAYNAPAQTVVNKPPDIPGLVFSPDLVLTEENILCEVDGEITDADGDSFTTSITWTRNGAAYKGLTDTTNVTGDTIPFNATDLEDKWGCTVTADDSTDKRVSDEAYAIVRPEFIIYYAEAKADLSNAPSTCKDDDGVEGYFGNNTTRTPFQWEFDDVYETDPDQITMSWRHGRWSSGSTYGYYFFNGAQLAYTNLGISRSNDCDSGRTYSVTFNGIQDSGLWNTGGVNSAGFASTSSWQTVTMGVFYDEEYEYGAMRVYTDVDPEEEEL